MIHSVLKFHTANDTTYPFLIFHDENFTTDMRQQILSCVLKSNSRVQISFALVNFYTNVTPNVGSRAEKSIGYRMMCRFWTYDVFYHPAVVQGRYEYLMRMDDDSYFSDTIKYDLFRYMKNEQLDYLYRSRYWEPAHAMQSVVKSYFEGREIFDTCIYNNFFIIRLSWFYKTQKVQSFVRDLLTDDLILREYIGDGCAHAIMIRVDINTKARSVLDFSYGHNYHIMPAGNNGWFFNPVPQFYDGIARSCQQLTVIRSAGQNFYRHLVATGIIVCLLIYVFHYHFRRLPEISNGIDIFLKSTICGRIIQYPNLELTNNELIQLQSEASSFFSSFSNDCAAFRRVVTVSYEELAYPLAFAILIYDNLAQFDFLLQTIYRRHNYYCIHVDIKASSSLYEAIQARSRCVSNIYVPPKRINVTWGHFTVLEAERLCQKELLKNSKTWKYYFNLAGSDIPLKTNSEMVQILKLYNDQNDVTSLLYPSKLRQKKVLEKRSLPPSIPSLFYKGEFHVLLSRAALEYIHTSLRVAELYDFLNGTSVPDEHFYSMINRWKDTPGYYPYDHDIGQVTFMTRYKIWGDRPEHNLCHGSYVRGICVFNYQDLWHVSTSPHLFGNKVFFEQDRLVPYCMAQYLDVRHHVQEENRDYSIIDFEFYQQLSNVRFGRKQ